MDLEVRHLQLVAAVADVGSLTRAGDRLHLTQSALSHQLRDIESRLGTALFLRLGKRLVLVPAIEMLLAGKIDLGLVSTPVRDRRLISRRVFDDELVLIASAQHRFAQQSHVRLAQMRDETLFVYPPKEESGPLQNVLLPAGAAPARVEEVQLTEAIAELVKAGLGVAILARWAVQPLINAGAIVGHTLPSRRMHRVWSAVMPKDLSGADHVSAFIDLLETHAPTLRRPTSTLTLA